MAPKLPALRARQLPPRLRGVSGLEPPQQAIDVVALDLWPRGVAGAPAQLVQDLLRALDAEAVDVGAAHAQPAVGIGSLGAVAGGAAERIALGVGHRAVGQVAEAAGTPEGAGHLIHHVLGRLLQGVEGLGLRAHGVAGRAAAERLGGIPHRPVGTPERLRHVALVAELTHHVAQHAPERVLLAGIALPLTLTLSLTLLAGPLLTL